MKPTVGAPVHYVSFGTPMREDGTQAYPSLCRAATITEVNDEEPAHVGLCILNPSGMFFCSLDEGGSFRDEDGRHGGTWHSWEDCLTRR